MNATATILTIVMLLAGCVPVDVVAPVKANVPVASPQNNRVGDVRATAKLPVSMPTSQPVTNSGPQAGAAGSGSWTANIGAVRVDGLALVVAVIVAGMVYAKIHGHVHRVRAARKGGQP
jgi:hypothetical protein